MSGEGSSAVVESLLAALSQAEVAPEAEAVIAVVVDKTAPVLLVVEGGRWAPCDAEGTAEPDVTVPVGSEQLAEFLAGTTSAAQAFMRGDLKPVGSTGALLPFLEALEQAVSR